jgi:hypothetical protein
MHVQGRLAGKFMAPAILYQKGHASDKNLMDSTAKRQQLERNEACRQLLEMGDPVQAENTACS